MTDNVAAAAALVIAIGFAALPWVTAPSLPEIARVATPGGGAVVGRVLPIVQCPLGYNCIQP